MSHTPSPRAGAQPPADWTEHVAWPLALVGLLAWQAWLTCGLLGGRDDPARLFDDRPVLSGRHPLHQYHGLLGARALLRHGCLSCYDPAFHAGYPKTPVFDAGSRPAELVLAATGGVPPAAAYKGLLAGVCLLVPPLLWLGGRAAGLSRAAAAAATLLGLAVWWGRPCRDAFEAGDVDLLLAALLLATLSGLLLRYHVRPGPLSLLGVLAAGFGAWLAHPVLSALLVPLFLIYYVRAGCRHGLAWHAALVGGLFAAVAGNAFWLLDLVQYAWIREPLRNDAPLTPRRLLALWEAPVWGGPSDRLLAVLLATLAVAGAVLFNRGGRREAARLFGLGALLLLLLTVAGVAWEWPARLGAGRLLAPALLFTVPLAAHALTALLRAGRSRVGLAVWLLPPVALAAALRLAPEEGNEGWPVRLVRPAPLRLGLDGHQLALADALQTHTTPEARILWEDFRGERAESNWSPLLPLLTERSFIGGLDAEAGIEHTACGLVDLALAGRVLSEWSDADLADYCERYNVGWVVCRSVPAAKRFAAWPATRRLADLGDGAVLFAVRRRPHFALSGQAQWLHADADRIVLGSVVPHEGRVVLSLHYQTGLRAWPPRVKVEPEYDPRDPVPFVRLVLEEEAPRVTLAWERR